MAALLPGAPGMPAGPSRSTLGRCRDRAIWLVNLALLVVMTLCVLSGALVSQVALYQLGISSHPGPFWTGVHDTTSQLTLALGSHPQPRTRPHP